MWIKQTNRKGLYAGFTAFLTSRLTYTPHGEPGSPGHVLPFLMFHCSLSSLRRDQAFRLISLESDYAALCFLLYFPVVGNKWLEECILEQLFWVWASKIKVHKFHNHFSTPLWFNPLEFRFFFRFYKENMVYGPYVIYYPQQVWDNTLLSNTLMSLQQSIWLTTHTK